MRDKMWKIYIKLFHIPQKKERTKMKVNKIELRKKLSRKSLLIEEENKEKKVSTIKGFKSKENEKFFFFN